jgi:hypothetical protein
MSIFFSKVIKAGERQREFNFRRMADGSDLKFHVDVPDDKGNRIIFQMLKNEEGRWEASTPFLPAWIQGAEQILNEAIQENASVLVRKK